MHPIALQPLLDAEFLEWLLESHRSPTTLVICCSREAFLDHLQASLAYPNPRDMPFEEEENAPISGNALLIPTLHLISTSQTIRLAFVPSLPHFRAYLATYRPRGHDDASTSPFVNEGSQVPVLTIWGFAGLHRSTVDFTAQGLSRSLAVAIEAAFLAGQCLVLAEPRQHHVPEDQQGEGSSGDIAGNPWKEQVPLLNGSLRFGSSERAWAGRTIEIGQVISKWCHFRRLENIAFATT